MASSEGVQEFRKAIEKALTPYEGQPFAQELRDRMTDRIQEMVKYMTTAFAGVAAQIKPTIAAHNRLEEAANQYAALTNEPPGEIFKQYQELASRLTQRTALTYADALDVCTHQLKERIRDLLMGPEAVSQQFGGLYEQLQAAPSKRSQQIAKEASKKWRDSLGKTRGKRRL